MPDDPKRLLRDGRADRSVRLLTTIAANEGLRFAPANITSEADFRRFLDLFLDAADARVREHVAGALYPPTFDGSLPYADQRERAALFWAELVSTCNIRYMHGAVDGRAAGYANLFDVWPSLHQGDVPYVFWNGALARSAVNATVAGATQDYITAFAITGDASSGQAPAMAPYDAKAIWGMSAAGFELVDDPTDNERCAYWHDATYQD